MRFFKERVASCGHIVRTSFVLTVVFVSFLICSLLHSASVSAQASTAGKDVSRASTNHGETPTLWSDPLGPFIKVLPSIVLALVTLALLEER